MADGYFNHGYCSCGECAEEDDGDAYFSEVATEEEIEDMAEEAESESLDRWYEFVASKNFRG
jgi:hypothetical protein